MNEMIQSNGNPGCCGKTRVNLYGARVNKAIMAVWPIILLFALIGMALPEHFLPTLIFTGDNLLAIAPFILLSAGLAGYLEAAGADKLIGRLFKDRVSTAIVMASLFGAISPFCSCGVIPLIAALLTAGVPLSAVMAFWIASPIMSPSMYVVTAAGLGTEFALVKTLSAIGIGLFAGSMTLLFQRWGFFSDALKQNTLTGGCRSNPLAKSPTVWKVWQDKTRLHQLVQKAQAMMLFLLKWLTLAFILESLMLSYLPGDLVASWLGSGSDYAIPLASLIGVPTYLNGFAAVPVVSGLLQNGMQPGAALSFMLAGAMTSIPAAIAVYSLVKKPLFIWYLALALSGAILAGFIFQWLQ